MRTAYDIIKDHYEANSRKDLDGMIADFAPDIQWTEMDGFPCRGTFIGTQEVVKNVFAVLGRDFEDFAFTLEKLLDGGTSAVGVGNYHGTCRATGKPFNIRAVHVWHVSEGRIDRFEQFTDTLRMAEAMR